MTEIITLSEQPSYGPEIQDNIPVFTHGVLVRMLGDDLLVKLCNHNNVPILITHLDFELFEDLPKVNGIDFNRALFASPEFQKVQSILSQLIVALNEKGTELAAFSFKEMYLPCKKDTNAVQAKVHVCEAHTNDSYLEAVLGEDRKVRFVNRTPEGYAKFISEELSKLSVDSMFLQNLGSAQG